MFSEDDLLPLSALQHLIFCERQCALIHIEGLWADNRLTVEGSHMHKKADTGPAETRGGVRITRGLALRSLRLGLIGKADAVEFPKGGAPFPVEYKRGQPKRDHSDEVQICAQALCLEEMLGVDIASGALFYGKTRRRVDVAFDAGLREETAAAARRLHEMVQSGVTPRAVRAPKCESCSLLELCLPDAPGPGRSARRYLQQALGNLEPAASLADVSPDPSTPHSS
jgi:CRISPR-associated exonuclease Cas4